METKLITPTSFIMTWLKNSVFIFFTLLSGAVYSQQGVSINTAGSVADPSAMLDVSSASKGLLIPRVSLISVNDITTIPNPAVSLLVYNTNAAMAGGAEGFWYFNGTIWVQALGPQGIQGVQGATGPTGAQGIQGVTGATGADGALNAWSLLGNSGTVDGTNFIGTTDNVPLNFTVNNQKAGRIGANGSTFIGYQAGNVNTATKSTGFGYQALYANTTGVDNTAFGYRTLYTNTTGFYNTAIGLNAMTANTTGNHNTATGMFALLNNTTGSFNTASGVSALRENTTGYNNTATGLAAMNGNTTGYDNTAFGYIAMQRNTTGNFNTATGSNSIMNNTTGSDNTSTGYYALYNNTTGNNNTVIGSKAGLSNVSGSSNVFLGYRAGYNETGSNKLYIANDSTSKPLIYGDFSTKTVKIYSNLNINNAYTFPTTDGITGQVLYTNGSGIAGWKNVLETETDPVFGASPANGITGTDITNWNTSFGWGDHALAGYLTSFTEMDTMIWKKNASNIYYNSGNVGIGTNSPVNALSVAGSANFSTSVLSPLYTALAGEGNSLSIVANDNPNGEGGSIMVTAGTGQAQGGHQGGNIILRSGSLMSEGYATPISSTITLTGNQTSQGGPGGNINIQGGAGTYNRPGGSVWMVAGSGNPTYANGAGGDVYVTAGNGSGSNPSGKTIISAGSGGTGSGYIGFQLGSLEKMRVAASGNVGIGTTVPLGLLHVSNTGNTLLKVGKHAFLSGLANNVAIDTAGSVTITGGSDVAGIGKGAGSVNLTAGAWGGTDRARILINGIGIGGTGGGILISGGFNTAGSISVGRRMNNGAPAGGVVISGGEGGSNGNGGSVTLAAGTGTGAVSYRGGDVIIKSGAGVSPSPAGNIIFRIGDAGVAKIDSLGRMGIGTLKPGAKLEVNGSVKITDGTQGAGKVLTSDANGLASWQNALGSETDPVFGASPAGGVSSMDIANWNTAYGWGNHAAAGYLTSYTETDPEVGANTNNYLSKWDGTSLVTSSVYDNGNVGIGTTITDAKLQIKPSAEAGFTLRLLNHSYDDRYVSIWRGTDGGVIDVVGPAVNPPVHLAFYISGSEKVRITDAGNVGIGTTTPSTKLDVNGVITATGGNSTIWNTAYGWGNHASAGYLTTEVDGSLTNEIQTLSISNDTISLSNGGGSVKIPEQNNIPALITYDDFACTALKSFWSYTTTGGAGVSFGWNYMQSVVLSTNGANTIKLKSNRKKSVNEGKLVFTAVCYTYEDNNEAYGPLSRGLVSDYDRNNAIEIINISGSSIQARTVSGGTATTTDYAVGASVADLHSYTIIASKSKVEFYFNGTLIATHTTNIPTVPLNMYFDASTWGGNVPQAIDDAKFEIIPY